MLKMKLETTDAEARTQLMPTFK